MAELLPIANARRWTKRLPNETEVVIRELDFSGPFAGKDDLPQLFLVDQPAGSVVEAHFHVEDEFQIVVGGNGRLGRHAVEPYAIHFSGRHTPYGPIVAGPEGIRYFTLRAHKDPGARFLPAERHALEKVPRRFLMAGEGLRATGPDALHSLPHPEIESLLPPQSDAIAAWVYRLGPNQAALGPECGSGGGQYHVVISGHRRDGDRYLPPLSCGFVSAAEPAQSVIAGPAGLELLVLQFPRPASLAPAARAKPAQWVCAMCGFVFDEAEGRPEDGIAPHTPWPDVPGDWTCPNCDAAKGDFERA